MKKIITTCLLILFSTITHAGEPVDFAINPSDSNISFRTIYEKDEVKGNFAKFNGEIKFHPEALDKSKVIINIETGSVTSTYDYAVDTLTTEGWFYPSKFAHAVFESSSFKSLGDNKYEVDGFLTITDNKQPLKLNFTLNKFDAKSAEVTGTAKLKRSDYKFGWEETDKLQDEVELSFKVSATAK
jgi:polyisoprenoid-binding protein YceI